jgi:uncharacterized protein involved in exopolysaccharide biosynthesis
MPESFDAYQYLSHLQRRWRLIATACSVAAGLALILGLLLPKRYTATARILIEPPGSSDPRAAMAVSPVYLESLRTYRYLAESDSLFKKAVDELKIRDPDDPEPLATLKKRILEVDIPFTTKILEISVTLPDPKQAQTLAAFLADETVHLSQTANEGSDKAQTAHIERLQTEARERVDRAEEESMRLAKEGPLEGLAEELEALVGSKALLQRQRFFAEEMRDELAREAEQLSSGDTNEAAEDRADTQERLAAAKGRVERLSRQVAELDQQITHARALLAARTARKEQVTAERVSAWKALGEVETRLTQARATVSARGERLQVIDPGVVPERPSWPNIPISVLVALLLALIGSTLYVTLEFSLQLRKAEARRQSLRVAGHG